MKRPAVVTILCTATALLLAGALQAQVSCTSANTVYAHVVALDQVIVNNRLGANMPGGMVFALARDVCAPGQVVNGQTLCDGTRMPGAGKVILKPYKRPRPMVLRVDQGQCLKIGFTNLLSPTPVVQANQASQPTTRFASVHVQGMELVPTPKCGATGLGPGCNDGSWVGIAPKPGGLVTPSSSPLNLQAPQITYSLYAAQEGAFLLYSVGDAFSATGSGDGGQLAMGLFGALHVEPADGEWYRSQVTAADLGVATRGPSSFGQPLINYSAVYKNTTSDPCFKQGTCRVGPVLAMSCGKAANPAFLCFQPNEIVHSDLTAVITGANAGRFKAGVPPNPTLRDAYSLPDRPEPYRELTIIYHEMFNIQQAFSQYYNIASSPGPVTGTGAGQDQFGINYGMAGIGSEVLANRLGVGPMSNCTSCKFEEFFLTSWAVGDPAMVVDRDGFACTITGACLNGNACDPDKSNQCLANTCNKTSKLCPDGKTACTQDSDCRNCSTTAFSCQNAPATRAFYPDDPSNVYHSYISDHTTFRILHGGSDLHHVHHQHAQQWLHSPDTSNGDYLDSQSIGPGSSFSLEMTYGASGNVNQTAGDSIFHCHFYPHFAGGMWSLWRVHDVYETGTELDADGKPKTGFLPGGGGMVTTTRALPDGEIVTGTPIPAVVPLPTIPMPPMPAQVMLAKNGTEEWVCNTDAKGTTDCRSNLLPADGTTDPKTWKNPGFPFFIPGLAGQRAAHPPLDFAKEADGSAMDGGLPRHLIRPCAGGVNGGCTESAAIADFDDFSKTLEKVDAFQLPEGGTFVEQVAMNALSQRLINSVTPEGSTTTVNAYDPPSLRPAQFIYNGLPPIAGAPYADPCIEYDLDGGRPKWHAIRSYKAADIQLDVTFNKEGWHFPQQRMIALWGDVKDYLSRARPPEPFFFRANSGDCIDYTLANLVPNVYELDDFQVRTPTDIIGQHIHLVKFDVTSSDGATNGFNYEDGTLAPNEVVERIGAINAAGGLWPDSTGQGGRRKLTAKPIQFFGTGPGGQWMGAQATVQRWYTDRLFDGTIQRPGVDRTLRTVFTHDHFGPSTHQQAGLYAGLVIEPEGSVWYSNDGGTLLGGDDEVKYQPLPLARFDGGPTSWQAVIETRDIPGQSTRMDSFREFLLEFQDTTLTYQKFSITPPSNRGFCSNNGAACTPATVTQAASGCTTGAVCYGYGFCSNSIQQRCTADAVANYLCGACVSGRCQNNSQLTCGGSSSAILACSGGGATCNLVAGIPSTAWGTTPLDSPQGVELITLGNATNSFSINYRNEPLFPRIDNAAGNPSSGRAGDLADAYASIDRPNLWCAFPGSPGCNPYSKPLTPGVGNNDPFTPLMRAYAGDDVQIRTLVGAHINPHNFTVHDVKWLEEPSFVDSGWRNSQEMGISEHFEEVFRLPSVTNAGNSDYLYMGGGAAIEQAGGNWGLLRAYAATQPDVKRLPQNPTSAAAPVCPPGVTSKAYTVVAITAAQALPGKQLVYNSRGPIADPNAILYFQLQDLNCPNNQPSTSCTARSADVQPLVLRANAGDCMSVTLFNMIQGTLGSGAQSPINYCTGSSGAAACKSNTSTKVGLHPQLVTFDVTTSNGFNVGNNKGANGDFSQLAAPGGKQTYTWYAGNIEPRAPAGQQHIPIEFGAANLLPADTLNHHQYGLFGALVIEPPNTQCIVPGRLRVGVESCTGTSAVIVYPQGQTFREFVLIAQDGLQGPTTPNPTLDFQMQTAFLTGDGMNAVNYRSEPLFIPGTTWRQCSPNGSNDLSCVLSTSAYCCSAVQNGNTCVFTPCQTSTTAGIQTPTFQACPGEQVRFRVLHGGGTNTNQVMEIFGHVWQEQPYVSSGKGCGPPAPTTQTNLYSSSTIGTVNGCNPLEQDTYSEYQGSRMGHGPTNHFDVLIESAGGTNRVPGDYLYRTYPADHFRLGLWGIFRVTPAVCDPEAPNAGSVAAGGGGR